LDDESRLVEGLKGRERWAWDTLYASRVRELYGFVFHLMPRNRSDAEEMHQDVWLAAVSGVEEYDPARGTLRDWLLGIARKRVALYHRRRRAERSGTMKPHEEACLEVEEPASVVVVPEECVEQVERAAVVRAALLAMPEDRRQVLLEKYVGGLPVREIAERSGRTDKAVESLLSRAREQLRRLVRWYFPKNSEVQDKSHDTEHIERTR
jgi:RNA polymerase sigma-70 factor (ECF subfamily)